MWKTVWDLKRICADYHVSLLGVCWPHALSSKQDKNKPSVCDKWGQQGHTTSATDTHAPIPGFNPSDPATRAKYSRAATKAEAAAIAALAPSDWRGGGGPQ